MVGSRQGKYRQWSTGKERGEFPEQGEGINRKGRPDVFAAHRSSFLPLKYSFAFSANTPAEGEGVLPAWHFSRYVFMHD